MLLACVPLIDARVTHGYWASIIVYAAVLATLQLTDKAALNRRWGPWRRIALKAVIVVASEAAVSISSIEMCDIVMTKCHRIFTGSVLLGFLIVVLIIAALIHYFSSRSGKFWQLAAKRADLALVLFAMEPHCLLDQEPPATRRKDFVGPFRLMDHVGQTHRIYIDHAHIDKIQARMSHELRDVLSSCTVHVLDPMQAGPRTETWNIGEHIGRETYEKWKDSKGDLYVLTIYEKGEPRSSVLQKEIWEQAAKRFAKMDLDFMPKLP